MKKQDLQFLGFHEIGDYKLKKNRPNFLVWDNLFAFGECIVIELTFDGDVWQVSKVKTEGEEAKKRVEKYLKSLDLSDVVEFVGKFPRSTNP